jgi:hypothetical protein
LGPLSPSVSEFTYETVAVTLSKKFPKYIKDKMKGKKKKRVTI